MDPVAALRALAHQHRLAAFRSLVQAGPGGRSVGELREDLGLAPATLTAHLNVLRTAGWITDEREGRVIRVRADLGRMHELIGFLTDDCCEGVPCARGDWAIDPGRPGNALAPLPAHSQPRYPLVADLPFHVLFLCTGNSARSILAEALLGTLGGDRFRAYSAGSRPSGQVQPLAAELATALGYPARCLRSKSWDEFAGDGATPMDIVITVCGNAADEACPVWPGHPVTAHWGVPDPAAGEGDDATRRTAYAAALATLRARVERLVQASLDRADPVAMQDVVRAIGEVDA